MLSAPYYYSRIVFMFMHMMLCGIITVLSGLSLQAQIPGVWKRCDLSKSIQAKDFRIDSTRHGDGSRIFIGSNYTKYVCSAGNGEFYVLRRIRVDSSFVDRPWRDTIRVQRRAYYVLQHLLNYGDSVETIREWLVDSLSSSLTLQLDGRMQPIIGFGSKADEYGLSYLYDRYLRFDTKTRTWNADFGGNLPPVYYRIQPFWSGPDSCIVSAGQSAYISSDAGATFTLKTVPSTIWDHIPGDSDSVFYTHGTTDNTRVGRAPYRSIGFAQRGTGYCSWPDLGIHYGNGGVTDAVWNIRRFFPDTVPPEVSLPGSIPISRAASDGVGFLTNLNFQSIPDTFKLYATVDFGRHWTRLRYPWMDSTARMCEFDNSRRGPCVLTYSIDSSVVSVAEYIAAEVPVQTIRWPIDGTRDINTAVRFVCPVRPGDDVELSVSYLDTTETFSMRGPTTLHTYRDAYTTYRWRYRVREGQSWSPWSSTWTFSTGSLRYWDPVDERKVLTSVHGGMLVASEGQGIQVSYDGGTSWNEVAVFKKDKIRALFPLLDGSVIIIDEYGNHAILAANGRDVPLRNRQRLGLGYLRQTMDGTIYSSGGPFRRSRDGGRTWDTIPIHGHPVYEKTGILPNGNIIIPLAWGENDPDADSTLSVMYDPAKEEIIYPSARTTISGSMGRNTSTMRSVRARSDTDWLTIMPIFDTWRTTCYQSPDGGTSWQGGDTQYVDQKSVWPMGTDWLELEHMHDGRIMGYTSTIPKFAEYIGEHQWHGLDDGLDYEFIRERRPWTWETSNIFMRSVDGTNYLAGYRLIDVGDPFPSYRPSLKNAPVTMEWKPYRGADRYRVQVYRSAPGSSLNTLILDTVVTDSRCSMGSIQDYTGRLYWNVTPSVDNTWLAPYSPRVIDIRDSVVSGVPEREQDDHRPLQIVRDHLSTMTTRHGITSITIHDLTGAVIDRIVLDVLDGRLDIPTARLPRGLYHALIQGAGTRPDPDRIVFFKE